MVLFYFIIFSNTIYVYILSQSYIFFKFNLRTNIQITDHPKRLSIANQFKSLDFESSVRMKVGLLGDKVRRGR